jgi:hypothetical protein
VANSFLPVAFNVAIFTAGILGAALLTNFSGLVLTTVVIPAGAALMLTIYGRWRSAPAKNQKSRGKRVTPRQRI